jgi:hypothetical protein
MTKSFEHLPLEKLADMAEDRLAAEDRVVANNHISACSTCESQLQQLADLINLMRSDLSKDAPRDLIAHAINLFEKSPARPPLLRRLVATLNFDSLREAPAFGMRSGHTTARQLLYSAEGNDIDLRVMVQDDKFVVAGQILREDCVSGRVEVSGPVEAQASLSDECEFTLPAMPPGSYRLRLQLPDVEIEVPELEFTA